MYDHRAPQTKHSRFGKTILLRLLVVCFFGLAVIFTYKHFNKPQTIEQIVDYRLSFNDSVAATEQSLISQSLVNLGVELKSDISARVITNTSTENKDLVTDVYVPVVKFGSVVQKVAKEDLQSIEVVMPLETDQVIASAVADLLGVPVGNVELTDLDNGQIAFIPIDELNFSLQLLEYEDEYYLDSFDAGAIFRTVVFDDTSSLASLKISELYDKEQTYKVNMTGVTALTRIMQRKLASVGDPLYFSELIGDFLADADLTHVSNEVSFKKNCGYSNTLFCSPPEFIETLKASGVDLVELTGNHNNDLGANYNTDTIELYRSLGWDTVGGGLNTEGAAAPVTKNQKGSNVTFLAYNFPDSPNGGAIAGVDRAGANSFDFTKIENDILAAKVTNSYVIVSVQYWECYAYPDGYIEFPECDKPIGEQESNFKKLIDLGADMVIGSSAHQPQTYEIYNGKPIYYGLGNLYFDQTSWPGTERGIILTHYFMGGNLIQTKLTPTVFDSDLQTRKMTDTEAEYLFQRLYDAR